MIIYKFLLNGEDEKNIASCEQLQVIIRLFKREK